MQLPGHAQDMGIVLREFAHARQTVQYARLFMPVDRAELEISQGQVLVAPQARAVNQHMSQAVHGLQAVFFSFHLGKIHVFQVVLQMA